MNKMIKLGVLFMGTARRDGTVRNSGVEPLIMDGQLWPVDDAYIGYDQVTHGQHVARWPVGTEYIRPATTPTSLGPPQPVRRVLQ